MFPLVPLLRGSSQIHLVACDLVHCGLLLNDHFLGLEVRQLNDGLPLEDLNSHSDLA